MVAIEISHAAYQQVSIEEVSVQLGRTTSLGEIRLRSRTYELPELVILGSAVSIGPSSTSYGANLRAADVEALPVERNYRDRVSLLPQANGSYYGDGVNIAGATGFENKYFVDGVEVIDPLIGSTGTSLPYNFVEEIELKAGGYDADSRSALGGLVNAITYSGTNELHGSVFGFYTNVTLSEIGSLVRWIPVRETFRTTTWDSVSEVRSSATNSGSTLRTIQHLPAEMWMFLDLVFPWTGL